jgi:hypothetical protein
MIAFPDGKSLLVQQRLKNRNALLKIEIERSLKLISSRS